MRRSTVILLIVLVLALAGAGVFFWLNQDQVTGLLNRVPENTNTAAGNVNRSLVNGSVPLIEGDQKLSGSVKVNDVTVTMTSFLRAGTFESIEAGKGQVFVVLYFSPVEPNQVLAVKRGLEANTHLNSGKTAYDLAGLKIASTLVTNDRGYLKFVVPDSAKNLELKVGDGEAAQTVKLP